MLVLLAVLLAVAWILGFTVMKVSSFAIHLLILFAVASLALAGSRGLSRRGLLARLTTGCLARGVRNRLWYDERPPLRGGRQDARVTHGVKARWRHG